MMLSVLTLCNFVSMLENIISRCFPNRAGSTVLLDFVAHTQSNQMNCMCTKASVHSGTKCADVGLLCVHLSIVLSV